MSSIVIPLVRRMILLVPTVNAPHCYGDVMATTIVAMERMKPKKCVPILDVHLANFVVATFSVFLRQKFAITTKIVKMDLMKNRLSAKPKDCVYRINFVVELVIVSMALWPATDSMIAAMAVMKSIAEVRPSVALAHAHNCA